MTSTQPLTTDMASQSAAERVDVAVIGAGQAGLVMGYFLGRQGRRFVILEAADSIGAAWRTRWDSLLLEAALAQPRPEPRRRSLT